MCSFAGVWWRKGFWEWSANDAWVVGMRLGKGRERGRVGVTGST